MVVYSYTHFNRLAYVSTQVFMFVSSSTMGGVLSPLPLAAGCSNETSILPSSFWASHRIHLRAAARDSQLLLFLLLPHTALVLCITQNFYDLFFARQQSLLLWEPLKAVIHIALAFGVAINFAVLRILA